MKLKFFQMLCWSVGASAGGSVRWLVGRSICCSVGCSLGQPVGGEEGGGEQQEVAVHVAGKVSSAEHCVHIATHLKAVVRFGGRKLDRAAVARDVGVRDWAA